MSGFLRPLILVVLFLTKSALAQPASFSVYAPDLVLTGIDFTLEVKALQADGLIDTTYRGAVAVSNVFELRDGKMQALTMHFEKGVFRTTSASIEESGVRSITVQDGAAKGSKSLRTIPGILSILPPLLAIVLALALRQVIISLFAGIWLGAIFIFDYDVFGGFLRVLDHYIIQALNNPDHVSIIAFSMLFGGMVGVISKNGGTYGIAESVIRMARTPARTQVATWLLGIVIFFDDYANALIVGNTMRPVTDRLRISREKLAYIVDSTAAPVSSIFFISTWIGYEIGLIDDALRSVGYHLENAYWILIESLPYRFYPILALVLGFLIAFTRRDFGPMFKAERRARDTGQLFREGAQLATDLTDSSAVTPDERTPKRWWNAALPIATVLVAALVGLYITGVQSIEAKGGTDFSIGNIVGSANSYHALLWASLLSCVVAIVLSVGQRILTLAQAVDAWFNGLKSMLLAMLILTFAWCIGAITMELHTADYLVQILRGNLSPHWLPVLTFLVAALISFATGTSWGTMGIIMPLVIPLAITFARDTGMDADATHIILLGAVSSVLAGSVFGDHCSPISDTTILSSMSSACDHVDHVRTQLPYAILVAVIGMIVGDIPTAFGVSPYLSMAVGTGAIVGILYAFGRKV